MVKPRRLHVHVLIDSLTWGGAENLLADFAIGARRADIDVSVAYLSDRPGTAERLRAEGIEPAHVPVSGLLKPQGEKRVRKHVAGVSPDLLHTHLGYSDFYGALASMTLHVPVVSTLHTIVDPGGPREWAKERLMAAARRRGAGRVIAVSDALRQSYIARGWDTPERVVTVHNGIVGGTRPDSGTRIRAELGIAPDDLVVAMVSVLRAGKGHDVATQAVAMLLPKFPNLRLLVLGSGPDEGRIAGDLQSLGDAALMTGHRSDVLEVLDAVDVLIHPSLVDALPTALMEAMATKTPVVATAVGGIPEIVSPGQTGLLIAAPPTPSGLADALEGLLADESRRRRLGEAGYSRFLAEFTVERWFQRLIPVYEAAMAEKTQQSPA
ncbi:MAG: glycosyltransferase family 4 protein [Solirubrobacterales bacterium]